MKGNLPRHKTYLAKAAGRAEITDEQRPWAFPCPQASILASATAAYLAAAFT